MDQHEFDYPELEDKGTEVDPGEVEYGGEVDEVHEKDEDDTGVSLTHVDDWAFVELVGSGLSDFGFETELGFFASEPDSVEIPRIHEIPNKTDISKTNWFE